VVIRRARRPPLQFLGSEHRFQRDRGAGEMRQAVHGHHLEAEPFAQSVERTRRPVNGAVGAPRRGAKMHPKIAVDATSRKSRIESYPEASEQSRPRFERIGLRDGVITFESIFRYPPEFS
jgi:hypothetical protein